MIVRQIYQRYLLKEILAAVLLVLLAFLALFSFFDLIEELRDVGKGGYRLHHALLYVALSLPGLIYELIPIATLIGALYALSSLARHSELTVLRAAGLSTWDLLKTLFVGAGALAFVCFLIGEALVPYAEKYAQQMRTQALNAVVAQQGFDTGLWVKDGRNFINILKVYPDATLEKIRIYEFDEAYALKAVLDADKAKFVVDQGWNLEGVTKTLIQEDRVKMESIDSFFWHSVLTPDLLSVLMVSPEKMSFGKLFEYARHLEDNRLKSARYQIAIWKKILYPMATLVMVALALPFGYSHSRVGGVSLKIFAGVMLGILFYMMNGLFSNLGVINNWPPFASAFMPSLLFLVMAMVMLWWAERR